MQLEKRHLLVRQTEHAQKNVRKEDVGEQSCEREKLTALSINVNKQMMNTDDERLDESADSTYNNAAFVYKNDTK